MQQAVADVPTISCEVCTSGKRLSFCTLDEDLIRDFRSVVSIVRYGPGVTVCGEGEAAAKVITVCSGRLKLFSTSSDGKVLLHGFAGPGDVLGVNSVVGRTTYDSTAVTTQTSAIGVISRENILRFAASDVNAMLRLVEIASYEYKVAQRKIRFLAFGATATARLAHMLLDWCETAGYQAPDGVHIRQRVTHNDLAQLVGSTRETVTRLLADLARQGIVSRTLDEIVVSDPERLRRLLTY